MKAAACYFQLNEKRLGAAEYGSHPVHSISMQHVKGTVKAVEEDVTAWFL